MSVGSGKSKLRPEETLMFECNLSIGFVCLVFSLTLVTLGQVPRTATTASGSAVRELAGLNDELQTLAARISPSVVKIEVSGLTSVHDPNSPTVSLVARESSIGSGIIVSSDGLILTNAHVVEHATSVQVTVYDHPDQPSALAGNAHRFKAKVLGRDVSTDIALIQIEARNLKPLTLADSDLVRVGEIGLTFGSPLGLENTVTLGVISSTQRQLSVNSPVIYLQTDASINPGNSGGPLVDIHGEVIGMNTMIETQSGGNEGVGFSIPSKTLAFVYEQLRTIGHVRRGALGISVSSISPDLAAGLGLPDKPGVILEDVMPGSSADIAGLHPGDVVTAIDERPIQEPQQLSVILFSKQVGDEVRFMIRRQDSTLSSIDVKVTRRPRDPESILDSANLTEDLVNRLGIIAVPLSPEIANLIPQTRMPQGLVIVALTAGGKGATLDLQVGDVLYTMNGKPLPSLEALRDLLNHLPRNAAIAFQLERDGKLQYLAFSNSD
jgi:serine protease Do